VPWRVVNNLWAQG